MIAMGMPTIDSKNTLIYGWQRVLLIFLRDKL